MTAAAPAHLVVYAKFLSPLAAFYERVLGLKRLEASERFVLLRGAGYELSIVAMPSEIAQQVSIRVPPERREETPIKLSFLVAEIESCRAAVRSNGGALDPAESAWSWRGQLHLDGTDPEGNVFQLRHVAAE